MISENGRRVERDMQYFSFGMGIRFAVIREAQGAN
jgi:hypothetical protein